MRYEALAVLLVDDNRHMRVLLGEILRAIGVRAIFEAGDGLEGLKLLKHRPVDLIITDLTMEPMDGLQFLKLLRTSPLSPAHRAPVIMITGHSTIARVNAARDAGVTEFLAKPINATAVVERVHRALEHPRRFVEADNYTGPDRRRRTVESPPAQRRSYDGA